MSSAAKSLKNFSWSQSLSTLWTVLIVLGVISFGFALNLDVKRAWANFLLDYVFWLSIGLAGIFFAALQHLTGSYWSVTVRRVAESFSAFIPYAFALFTNCNTLSCFLFLEWDISTNGCILKWLKGISYW